MRRIDISDPNFDHDDRDPAGYRVGALKAGPKLGAVRTGTTVYELPPGEAVCPYHYELGEEEWLLVLEGRASVRTPAGTEQLGPMQLAFFPTGPDGAHQIRNETDSRLRVLMWSEVVVPTATVYPDSDKIGIWTGDRSEDVIVERSSRVDYYHGEATGT